MRKPEKPKRKQVEVTLHTDYVQDLEEFLNTLSINTAGISKDLLKGSFFPLGYNGGSEFKYYRDETDAEFERRMILYKEELKKYNKWKQANRAILSEKSILKKEIDLLNKKLKTMVQEEMNLTKKLKKV